MPMPPEKRKPVAGKAMGSLENGKVGNRSNSEHSSDTVPLQVPPLRRRVRRRIDGRRSSLVGQSLDCVIMLAVASFVMFAIAGLLP